MEVLVDGVLVHCRWKRHLMNAKVERRQAKWRRDVSHPDFGTDGGCEITPDRVVDQDACGIRAQGPAG